MTGPCGQPDCRQAVRWVRRSIRVAQHRLCCSRVLASRDTIKAEAGEVLEGYLVRDAEMALALRGLTRRVLVVAVASGAA